MPRYKAVYSPESIQEIKNIVEWYSDISPELGRRFKNALLTEIAAIKKAPFARSLRYDDVRFAVVKNFPYAAHYSIDSNTALIKIQAVLGFVQDSEANWQMRF